MMVLLVLGLLYYGLGSSEDNFQIRDPKDTAEIKAPPLDTSSQMDDDTIAEEKATAESKAGASASTSSETENMGEPGSQEQVEEEGLFPFEDAREGFSKTVEASIEDLFETELRRVNCGTLMDLRAEVIMTYKENKRLQEFLRKWAQEIKRHGCK